MDFCFLGGKSGSTFLKGCKKWVLQMVQSKKPHFLGVYEIYHFFGPPEKNFPEFFPARTNFPDPQFLTFWTRNHENTEKTFIPHGPPPPKSVKINKMDPKNLHKIRNPRDPKFLVRGANFLKFFFPRKFIPHGPPPP